MDVLNAHLPRLLDLASNFNIDLSGVLAGYAEKLRNDNVPEMQNFSFPEAALLLQHCAEIYGRKVDYVYNLVIELSEHMNVDMYGSHESAQGENVDGAVAMTMAKKTRRRKTVGPISTEDFQLESISLGKAKTIKKYKKNANHCREAMCVRLTPVNLRNLHEFDIFEDDQYTSIGTKDQFRLNWSMEQNCRLEEYRVNDEGSGGVWDVMDVGVSNMPTPEYSDGDGDGDGGGEDGDNGETTLIEQELDICNAMSAGAQETDKILNSNLTPETSDNPTDIVDKPIVSKKVQFKLPYELTKKGCKDEKNITMFLFSNLLRRELKMKGTLPPFTNKRNGDKKLIDKHIQFLMERFNLGKSTDELNMRWRTLTEPQEDFLGFEEVVLKEIPDVLDATSENNPNDLITDSDAVAQICENDDGLDTHCSDEIDVPIQCNAKKKSNYDSEGVRNWRHFIQEKLAIEETQRNFDVHEYGSNIIDSFQNVGQTLSFAEIVGGQDSREVARYFVSTLMLANTSNMTLKDNGPDSLTVTLNHRERYHDMENILVPPSAGGISSSGQSKRKANSDEDETTPRRSLKQSPGKGPWKNKSKKSRDR